MDRVFKATIAASLVTILALAAFLGGALFERMRSDPVTPGSISDISRGGGDKGLPALISQVQDRLRAEALKPSSETSMTSGAINGLLGSLGDKYAAYFDPKESKEFQLGSKGEFFGVGMTIGMQETSPTVGQVFEGSPAAKAKIKTGDVVVAIDGVRKSKWQLDDVVGRIRGPEGTKVRIEIARPRQAKLLVFQLKRARITIPNITSHLFSKNVGYVRLMQFNELSAADIRKAMATLQGKGARAFILDLRDNPGGLLRSAVEVTSLYVDGGVVVRVDERGKPEEKEVALRGMATDLPLVVLVNGNSASASEIVAGALQDYKRAIIIGEKSFGKGSVQTIENLPNGGSIKFTTAHYLTPKSRVIDGKGVVPEIVVKMDQKLQIKHETDTQLQRAIQELKRKL